MTRTEYATGTARTSATRCRICGLPLKVPLSVKRGVGPVCWGRLKRGEIKEETEV